MTHWENDGERIDTECKGGHNIVMTHQTGNYVLLTAPGFHDEGFVIQLIVNAALIFAGKLYQILKKSHLRKRSSVPQSRRVLALLSGKHTICL